MSLRRKVMSDWRASMISDFGTDVERKTRKAPVRRIAARSGKMERAYEVRRELVTEMLAAIPLCQAGGIILGHLFKLDPGLAIGGGNWRSVRAGLTCGGQDAPDDVHELMPRSAGGSITERENCIAVCRLCHGWLHAHPSVSRKLGLLKSRYAVS